MSTNPPPDPPAPGPPVPDPPRLPGTGRGPAGGRGDPARGELSLQVLALGAELAGVRADLATLAARLELVVPSGPGDVADLQADVDELRAQVTTLHEAVADLAASPAGQDEPPAGICWADLDAGARAEALVQVRDWVHDVLLVWHPDARKALRPCWYRHRDVLSDLAALYEVWCWAYRAPDATPGRREEWHASWLPDWIERSKTSSSQRECSPTHDPRPPVALGPEWTDGFDQFAAWFADHRGESEPPAPGPRG